MTVKLFTLSSANKRKVSPGVIEDKNQHPDTYKQTPAEIQQAIHSNLDRKSYLASLIKYVPNDFDGTEMLATMSSLKVANVSLHAQLLFNLIEKMKLESDQQSLQSFAEGSFSDENFKRFKQGEKNILNVLARYDFKKDDNTSLPDHSLDFNLESLQEIEVAAKDMLRQIPFSEERELFGLYFQRVSACVKHKLYMSYEKEYNQLKSIVDNVEDYSEKNSGGIVGPAIGLPSVGGKSVGLGLGVALGYKKTSDIRTGTDSSYYVGNYNEFALDAGLNVSAKLLGKGVSADGRVSTAYTNGRIDMWDNLNHFERKLRQMAADKHKNYIAEKFLNAKPTVSEKEFDKATQLTRDSYSRLCALFCQLVGAQPSLLQPDVKRSSGWVIDYSSLDVGVVLGGGVSAFADVAGDASTKIRTTYMKYWDPLSFDDALKKRPALIESIRKEGLTAFSDQFIGPDKQELDGRGLANKAKEGLAKLDTLSQAYYGLTQEINRQNFSESNNLVNKETPQNTQDIVNEVLDRLDISVKKSWLNEQCQKTNAIEVLSKIKQDCQHKINPDAVGHHHFTIAAMRSAYGHLAHTVEEHDSTGKLLPAFKGLANSLKMPPVEYSPSRINEGGAFKHIQDMPRSSLITRSKKMVEEGGVMVMREDTQSIDNINYWYNKLRCGTYINESVKHSVTATSGAAVGEITEAIGGVADALGIDGGYQGSYGKEVHKRTLIPYWSHENNKNNEVLKDLGVSTERVRTHKGHGPYAAAGVPVTPGVDLDTAVFKEKNTMKTHNQTFGPTGALYILMLQMKNWANRGHDTEGRIRKIAEKNMNETVGALKGITDNAFVRSTFESMQDSVLAYYRDSLVVEAKKDLKDIQGLGGSAMGNARVALKASLDKNASQESKLRALNDLKSILAESLPIADSYLPPSARKSFFALMRLFAKGKRITDMNYLNLKTKDEVSKEAIKVIENNLKQTNKSLLSPLGINNRNSLSQAGKTLDDLIDSIDYIQRKGALKDLIEQSASSQDEKETLLETLARVRCSKNPEQKDIQELQAAIGKAEESRDPSFNKAHQREALNASYQNLLEKIHILKRSDNDHNRTLALDAFFAHSKELNHFFRRLGYDPYRLEPYKNNQRQVALFGNTLMSKMGHTVLDPIASKIKPQKNQKESPLLIDLPDSKNPSPEQSQLDVDRRKLDARLKTAQPNMVSSGDDGSKRPQVDGGDIGKEALAAQGKPASSGNDDLGWPLQKFGDILKREQSSSSAQNPLDKAIEEEQKEDNKVRQGTPRSKLENSRQLASQQIKAAAAKLSVAETAKIISSIHRENKLSSMPPQQALKSIQEGLSAYSEVLKQVRQSKKSPLVKQKEQWDKQFAAANATKTAKLGKYFKGKVATGSEGVKMSVIAAVDRLAELHPEYKAEAEAIKVQFKDEIWVSRAGAINKMARNLTR